MMDEKTLSEEEQKAKEYVDFYYFWLFHYCGRNYSRELDKRIPHYNGTYDYSVAEQRQNIAQEIYWAHPLSRMYPQFLPGDDFTEVDELYCEDCSPDDQPDVILENLYNGIPIKRNIEYNNSYGTEIIGTNGAFISTDGHLRGTIIAKIDLRAPISSILFELSKLKEERFDSFPNFLDAPPLAGIKGNYTHQYNIIKQMTRASFSVKDDAARAIGLWFYDAIDGSFAIFKSFAEVWKVICKEPTADILVGSAEDAFFTAARKNNTNLTWAIPSRAVFAKLGYSASDPSVFRRLYRNTQKCIEECEVLSLKS